MPLTFYWVLQMQAVNVVSRRAAGTLVPKFCDPRRRYRAVVVPLRAVGNIVTVENACSLYQMVRTLGGVLQCRYETVVLVGCGMKPLVLACAARLAGSAVVLRLGGDPFIGASTRFELCWRRWRFGEVLRAAIFSLSSSMLLRICRDVIVVNTALANVLARRCQPTTRFHVIPQAVLGDSEMHSASSCAAVNLLTVTNLSYPQKAEGVIWLIERLRGLELDGGRRFVFRVAGAGEGKVLLDRYLADNALPSNFTVELLGFVADVAYEYRRADIFVYNSEFDATPNVLLEAKRFGLPVLVNDYEPLKEVVRDGVSGVVYSDPDGFYAGLLRLCSEPKLCSLLAEGGRNELRDVYSIKAVGTALKVLLEDVARQHGFDTDAQG